MFATDGVLGFGMGLGMVIFWILMIVVVVIVVRMVLSATGTNSTTSTKSPMEILKERFARGEIDEEEFKRRRHELEK
jgi:putative membrane protein